jgi:hypothetical protein
VTRESVRIAFLYAALNDLNVLGCDVSNAYLNAPCLEKIWVHARPEFGGNEGAVVIVPLLTVVFWTNLRKLYKHCKTISLMIHAIIQEKNLLLMK